MTSRVEQIISTITQEVESGASSHWEMPFDAYVNERIGDLDLDADREDFDSKVEQIRSAVDHLADKHRQAGKRSRNETCTVTAKRVIDSLLRENEDDPQRVVSRLERVSDDDAKAKKIYYQALKENPGWWDNANQGDTFRIFRQIIGAYGVNQGSNIADLIENYVYMDLLGLVRDLPHELARRLPRGR